MKKFFTAMFIGIIMALSACGVAVSSGTVVNKEYKEAYTTEEEVMERDCDTKKSFGKKKSSSQSCKMEGTGEFETTEHPAEYTITLRDKQGNEEDHNVTEEEYNSVEEGDFFDTKK